jgi:hypothetical protein
MDPSLGILLADSASLARATELATADTHWFLMDDGVRAIEGLRSWIDRGADVTVCATDAAGLEPVPGVRFGSQYDHAVMVRTARRLIALTGAGMDDHSPKRAERTVIVRITRELKLAQALRSAVGYAGGDLRVAVLTEPAVQQVIDHPPAGAARALATLRSLDHPIVPVAAGEYPARLRWDVEVTW